MREASIPLVMISRPRQGTIPADENEDLTDTIGHRMPRDVSSVTVLPDDTGADRESGAGLRFIDRDLFRGRDDVGHSEPPKAVYHGASNRQE